MPSRPQALLRSITTSALTFVSGSFVREIQNSAARNSSGYSCILMENLLGAQLLSKSGTVATAQVLAGKNYVMIYFSAHWY